jgi:hypothetical protein
VVDKTGVGGPVVDMFRDTIADRRQLQAITITSGGQVTRSRDGYHVPKRDLVMGLVRAHQEGRFRRPQGLALGEVFSRELSNFRVKINLKTAHDSYEAWREGDHDDLVLSVSLATWFAMYILCRIGR